MNDTFPFPENFLFGASVAAHQVEGGNTNSDWWWWEHIESTPCHEPSGDACDFYHRYRDDISLLAGLGLNAFRFGIEWARIEPAEGEFSQAALDHYGLRGHCKTSGQTGLQIYVPIRRGPWFHGTGALKSGALKLS